VSRRGISIAAVLVLSGLASYGAVSAVRSWLGDPRETEPLRVSGAFLDERVASARDEVHRRYPDVAVEVIGVSAEQVMFKVAWKPPGAAVADYAGEIAERVQDQREATVLLLKAVAREPSVRFVGAFEDSLIVPVWSRAQIKDAADPALYRDWDTYSHFQHSAVKQGGYARLNE